MKNKKISSTKIESETTVNKNSVKPASHFKWFQWIVFLLGSLIYTNTLGHQYTQDDAIVIYDNMYTTKGVSGWPGLFSKDTFFGFFKTEGKANLVKGGRYRPLTPAMFAVEYQLSGGKPWLGHLINVILYGLLCMMIYKLLLSLFLNNDNGDGDEAMHYMALAAALIFAVHPLHTEAVANIKGRDEIMAMMGAVVSTWCLLRYIDKGGFSLLIYSCIAFFLGLMSKENTITYLAVIPLALFVFRKMSFGNSIVKTLPLLAPTVLFLMIRFAILGADFGDEPRELMNNPYLKMVSGNYVPFTAGERFATIMYTLGKYVMLLLWPHPLTNDYYPRHIDIMSFGNPKVLLSLLLYIGIAAWAVIGVIRRSITGFAAAYFLITISLVSNIIFPIGTNMSERFMFMPSLGFAIALAYLIVKFAYRKDSPAILLGIVGVIALPMIAKTFVRNGAWKDDFTLYTTDVKVSNNSAKALNAAGGVLVTNATKETDPVKKNAMLKEAIPYLDKAAQIHPHYKNAYLIKGNGYYYLSDFENAIKAYEAALAIDPEWPDAIKNLAVSLRDAGRIAGEQQGNVAKAMEYLQRSIKLYPQDTEALRLLGVANGISGNHVEALNLFKKIVEIDPQNAGGYVNLHHAFNALGQLNEAAIAQQKAVSIDPNAFKK